MNALQRYFAQMGYTQNQQTAAMNWLQDRGAISDNATNPEDVALLDALHAATQLHTGFHPKPDSPYATRT
jgi:hypothetical protein